jgi:hypothetical protein
MPPQQGQNLLDFGDGLFDFRAHWSIPFNSAPRVADELVWINRLLRRARLLQAAQ